MKKYYISIINLFICYSHACEFIFEDTQEVHQQIRQQLKQCVNDSWIEPLSQGIVGYRWSLSGLRDYITHFGYSQPMSSADEILHFERNICNITEHIMQAAPEARFSYQINHLEHLIHTNFAQLNQLLKNNINGIGLLITQSRARAELTRNSFKITNRKASRLCKKS